MKTNSAHFHCQTAYYETLIYKLGYGGAIGFSLYMFKENASLFTLIIFLSALLILKKRPSLNWTNDTLIYDRGYWIPIQWFYKKIDGEQIQEVVFIKREPISWKFFPLALLVPGPQRMTNKQKLLIVLKDKSITELAIENFEPTEIEVLVRRIQNRQ